MAKKETPKVNKLQITKVIYGSRIPKTAEEVKQIILLEIKTHESTFEDVVYEKLTGPVHNSDSSQTYIIHFKYR